MSGFKFGADRGSRGEKHGIERALGAMPGLWGVAQEIAGHWSIRDDERHVIRYGKACLDTAGTVWSYVEAQREVQDEGSCPTREWLRENGYTEMHQGRAFGTFVAQALQGVTFTRKTIKGKLGKDGPTLLEFVCGEGGVVYFIDSAISSANKRGDDEGPSIWWAGPFVKKGAGPHFVAFVRQALWDRLGSPVALLTTTNGNNWDSYPELLAVDEEFDFVSACDVHNDVDAMAKRARAFLDKGISRTMLFHGPPGTGKSTLARALARGLGGRTVMVDHAAMEVMNRSAHMVIWLMGPTTVIMNDVDRSSECDHRELLSALESKFGDAGENTVTCLTVNDLNRLDPALLRPGRISEVVKVPEPSAKSREIVLCYYVAKFGLDLGGLPFDEIVEEMDQFSPADIREFVQTAHAVGPEIARGEIARIQEQRKLFSGDRCSEWNSERHGKVTRGH